MRTSKKRFSPIRLFSRNGAFDQRTYEQTLRANKMTPEEFEEMQRKVMTATAVEDLIRDAVRVSDQEVYELYRMQSEKINVDFIQVSPKTYTGGIKTTPADLEAFLKAHEGQFRVPEQVQIKYLAFMGQDYASAAQIPDADVPNTMNGTRGSGRRTRRCSPSLRSGSGLWRVDPRPRAESGRR